MCEAEHSTRSFLTGISAAKSEKRFASEGRHDKVQAMSLPQYRAFAAHHHNQAASNNRPALHVSIPFADALKATLDSPRGRDSGSSGALTPSA
jgi:hypothetical protein